MATIRDMIRTTDTIRTTVKTSPDMIKDMTRATAMISRVTTSPAMTRTMVTIRTMVMIRTTDTIRTTAMAIKRVFVLQLGCLFKRSDH